MAKTTSFTIVHFHFHRRKTGVTKSIEQLLPLLKKQHPSYLFGYGIAGEKIGLIRLLKVLYSTTPVVVHVHRNNEMLSALILRYFGARFRLFFTRHSATPPSGMTRFLMRKADHCVFLTQNAAFTPSAKSSSLPHGIDLNYFTPGTSAVNQRKTIGVVGRIRPMKGQAVVLDGLLSFLQKNPDWTLRFIGKIDSTAYVKQMIHLATTKGVRSQVVFEEPTDAITAFYQRCSLIINASFSEGFSLVPLEAIACGCTVIATQGVGIHSTLIKDGKNGFLFSKGDHDQLALLVNDIVSKERFFTTKTLQQSVKEWDINTIARKTLAVYKTALTDGNTK